MKCARTACDSQNALCRHTENGNLYCPRCARRINEFAPGLVAWPTEAMETRLNERGYFLRDDRPIREGVKEFKGIEEAYSLHTVNPFQRHAVFGGPREWAVLQAYKQVFET